MSMLVSIHRFNKLRRSFGWSQACNVYINLYIRKTGSVKLKKYKHPFRIRINDSGDSSTFNEVILRNEYKLNLSFNPYTIIDCGANIGLSSISFTNQFPGAKIIAIEPSEQNFQLLCENVKPYKDIKAVYGAVWHKDTELNIVDTGRGTNAFIVQETNEPDSSANIKAISIASIMKKEGWKTIDILKIDIEGSEKEIFSYGYKDWLPLTKVLIVETHDRFRSGSSRALFKAVSDYNFDCTIHGFNFVFLNKDL